MAIAVQSTSTTGYTTSVTSINIAKPTGLTEGDLMVAMVGYVLTTEMQPPAGWTVEYNFSGDLGLFYKIADSSDVAASNFTFTLEDGAGNPDAGNAGGCILRIDGHDPNDPIFDFNTGTDTSVATSFSISHSMEDPAIANHLLLFHVIGFDDSEPAISALTVTGGTSPTFTQVQSFDDSTNNFTCEAHYAIKTDDTPITAYGGTSSDPVGDGDGTFEVALMILRPQNDGDGSHATLNGTGEPFTSANTSGTAPDMNVLNATGTLQATSGNVENPTRWTNEDDAETTWTNESL